MRAEDFRLFLTSLIFFSASTYAGMQSKMLIAPALKEFGYESISDILEYLPKLSLVEIPETDRERLSWFILSPYDIFSGREYYLVKNSKGEVFFAVAREAHGIFQTFGPLVKRTKD